MRRCVRLVPLVALAALSIASVGTAGGGGLAKVQGKGTVDFGGSEPSEVAIAAVRTPDGTVNGHVVQTDPGHGSITLEVSCIRPSTITTTRVMLGGVIVSSYVPANIGQEALYIVDDLSSLGGGQVDQIGGAGLGSGASTCPFDPGSVVSPLYPLITGNFKLTTH